MHFHPIEDQSHKHDVLTQSRSIMELDGIRLTLSSLGATRGAVLIPDPQRITISAVLEQVGGSISVPGAARSRDGIEALPPSRFVSIYPIGMAAAERTEYVLFLRHLVIELDPAMVPPAIGAALSRPGVLLADAQLIALCAQLARVCAGEEPGLDVLRLVASLAQRYAQLSTPRWPQSGGLAPWQLRRLVEHVSANLARRLPLTDLARLVNLSTSHFSRAFKRSTGFSPHSWLAQLRCERAKQLLLQQGAVLAEIALEVGFCDQAHFTRAFNKQVGDRPGAWRRARLAISGRLQ